MFIRRYRTEILIALAALVIAACWLPIRMRFPFDDTYITFRYAANLAHGFGIVWNVGGAHTEGYTNFLLVLLLAPFSAIGFDLVIVAQAIGVIAVTMSAILIFRLLRNVAVPNGSVLAIFGPALFLLDPFTWMNAYSGLETSLFTMWLLLAIWAFAEKRNALAFVIATLATLTRPEGALMGMILFLVIAIQFYQGTRGTPSTQSSLSYFWSHARPAVLWFALPLLLFAAWKLWYFGNLLPNSFYIKVAQAQGTTFLPGRGSLRIFYEGVWYLLPFALIAMKSWRHNEAVRIAALWCAALSLFYLFSQLIQPNYGRFTLSIEVLLMVLSGIGYGRWAKKYALVTRYALLLMLVVIQVFWSLYVRGALGDMTRDTSYEDRYQQLAAVLRSIPDHEHITLAWADAGILPYYSGLRHIDLVGLNTNTIARTHSPSEVIAYILHERPDLIFIPLDTNGKPFTGGHGFIGSSYAALQQQAMQSGYISIARIPQTVYIIEALADTTSPHYRDLLALRSWSER